MSSSNRLIVSILLVGALAVAFWMLLLGPKREEASELSSQAAELRVAVSEARGTVAEAVAARREFPEDYEQLVVLGQAVPAGDETASLLVELNEVATKAKVKFESIQLSGAGEAAPPPETAAAAPATGSAPSGATPAAVTVPPTEAAASVMPLGATVGPAGLAKMPYNLTFSGDFFRFADFIEGIDSLVDTGKGNIAVDGRLVTLDGFALNPGIEGGFPQLSATFAVTTYVVPPGQGITAGATPAAPAPSIATPAATAPAGEAPAEATPVSEAQ